MRAETKLVEDPPGQTEVAAEDEGVYATDGSSNDDDGDELTMRN